MSEIRYNTITGDWVIIATERAKRPIDFVKGVGQTPIRSYVETCPFCRGNETASPDEEYRLNDAGGSWQVRSVRNKFSALSGTGETVTRTDSSRRIISGVGRHEVIIETPRHDLYLPFHTPDSMTNILNVYKHRFLSFYADSRVKHVIIYKNHGPDAGTSLEHPHSQVVGTPVIPGQVVQRLDLAERSRKESGKCLYCQTLEEELTEQSRLVAENEHFIAFIPYASLSPYHVWIFPRRHSACFATAEPEALASLGHLLVLVLGKLFSALHNPSYNFVIRSLSPSEADLPYFHWYLAIVPRLSKAAGFELGTGMYINSSIPENSAATLRQAAVPVAPGSPQR